MYYLKRHDNTPHVCRFALRHSVRRVAEPKHKEIFCRDDFDSNAMKYLLSKCENLPANERFLMQTEGCSEHHDEGDDGGSKHLPKPS